MKNLLLSAVLFAAVTASAGIVPQTFTLTATLKVQSPPTTNTAGLITIAAPKPISVTTASLLKDLATVAYLNGDYAFTTFPTGAKIVYLNDPDNSSWNHFIVASSTGAQLADVSAILYYEQPSATRIQSGKFDTKTQTYPTWTETYLGQVVFTDYAVGGNTKIAFGGNISSTFTDVVNTKAGTYKETWTSTLTAGIGEGFHQGTPCQVSGTASATGSATFAL